MALDLVSQDTGELQLLQYGVSEAVISLVSGHGRDNRFISWQQVVKALYYTSYNKQASSSPGPRQHHGFLPADYHLLQEVGVCISTDLDPFSFQPRSHWWVSPFQKLSAPGCPPDDTFPAEFRCRLLGHTASLTKSPSRNKQGGVDKLTDDVHDEESLSETVKYLALPADRVISYTYLFAQVQYVDATAGAYTFMGYTLNKAQKEKLFTRWQRDYPELSEGFLSAWDVPGDAQHEGAAQQGTGNASGPYHEAQCTKFRPECWAALRRPGLATDNSEATDDCQGPVIPLPDWLGAIGPAAVAGGAIPQELQDTYRVDPYGNILSSDAEQGSICAWDVDHVFPRRRGGRSVLQNFVATHWYAKRHVKTHKILSTIMIDPAGHNPLTTGLTETGLTALWEARQKLPKALSEAGAFKQLLNALLCTSWRRGGDPREMFNTKAGLLHVTPHDQLLTVLLQEFRFRTASLVSGWQVGLNAASALTNKDQQAVRDEAAPHPKTLPVMNLVDITHQAHDQQQGDKAGTAACSDVVQQSDVKEPGAASHDINKHDTHGGCVHDHQQAHRQRGRRQGKERMQARSKNDTKATFRQPENHATADGDGHHEAETGQHYTGKTKRRVKPGKAKMKSTSMQTELDTNVTTASGDCDPRQFYSEPSKRHPVGYGQDACAVQALSQAELEHPGQAVESVAGPAVTFWTPARRSRNPLADPYIVNTFHNAYASPGSSLQGQGIVQSCVHAALSPGVMHSTGISPAVPGAKVYPASVSSCTEAQGSSFWMLQAGDDTDVVSGRSASPAGISAMNQDEMLAVYRPLSYMQREVVKHLSPPPNSHQSDSRHTCRPPTHSQGPSLRARLMSPEAVLHLSPSQEVVARQIAALAVAAPGVAAAAVGPQDASPVPCQVLLGTPRQESTVEVVQRQVGYIARDLSTAASQARHQAGNAASALKAAAQQNAAVTAHYEHLVYERQAMAMATHGNITTYPHSPGGPWPISNPYMGPGMPHPVTQVTAVASEANQAGLGLGLHGAQRLFTPTKPSLSTPSGLHYPPGSTAALSPQQPAAGSPWRGGDASADAGMYLVQPGFSIQGEAHSHVQYQQYQQQQQQVPSQSLCQQSQPVVPTGLNPSSGGAPGPLSRRLQQERAISASQQHMQHTQAPVVMWPHADIPSTEQDDVYRVAHGQDPSGTWPAGSAPPMNQEYGSMSVQEGPGTWLLAQGVQQPMGTPVAGNTFPVYPDNAALPPGSWSTPEAAAAMQQAVEQQVQRSQRQQLQRVSAQSDHAANRPPDTPASMSASQAGEYQQWVTRKESSPLDRADSVRYMHQWSSKTDLMSVEETPQESRNPSRAQTLFTNPSQSGADLGSQNAEGQPATSGGGTQLGPHAATSDMDAHAGAGAGGATSLTSNHSKSSTAGTAQEPLSKTLRSSGGLHVGALQSSSGTKAPLALKIPPITDLDLPPPAFDRHRDGGGQGSSPGVGAGAAGDAAGNVRASLKASNGALNHTDSDRSSRGSSSGGSGIMKGAKKAMSKALGKLGGFMGVGKNKKGRQKLAPPVDTHPAFHIAIMASSLEVVKEEAEEDLQDEDQSQGTGTPPQQAQHDEHEDEHEDEDEARASFHEAARAIHVIPASKTSLALTDTGDGDHDDLIPAVRPSPTPSVNTDASLAVKVPRSASDAPIQGHGDGSVIASQRDRNISPARRMFSVAVAGMRSVFRRKTGDVDASTPSHVHEQGVVGIGGVQDSVLVAKPRVQVGQAEEKEAAADHDHHHHHQGHQADTARQLVGERSDVSLSSTIGSRSSSGHRRRQRMHSDAASQPQNSHMPEHQHRSQMPEHQHRSHMLQLKPQQHVDFRTHDRSHMKGLYPAVPSPDVDIRPDTEGQGDDTAYEGLRASPQKVQRQHQRTRMR